MSNDLIIAVKKYINLHIFFRVFFLSLDLNINKESKIN